MSEEMRALLKKHYEQPDSPNKLGLTQGHVDIWKLEDTISSHPEEWGWQGKTCAVCSLPECTLWSQETGYRCEGHRA